MNNVTQYNKAIVAFLVPLLTWLAGRYGLDWTADTIAVIATLAGTVAVYLIPNKQQPAIESKRDVEKPMDEDMPGRWQR